MKSETGGSELAQAYVEADDAQARAAVESWLSEHSAHRAPLR